MMENEPAFNAKLVQIVQKYNVLYDHTMEDYNNRQVQEKTWNEVGKQINETGVACKEKWKNLRSAYTRYLRQKSSSVKTMKKYYLADYLSFLIPYTKFKLQPSNFPSPKSIKEETSNSFFENDFESTSEFKAQDEKVESEFILETLDEAVTEDIQLTSKNKVSHRKREEIKSLDKCAIDHFTCKSICHTELKEDADLLFLKSLLPDLHRMTNVQKHEFKWKTMKIIGEILYTPTSSNSKSTKKKPKHCNIGHHARNISPHRTSSALSNNSQTPSSIHSSSQVITPLQSPISNDYEFC